MDKRKHYAALLLPPRAAPQAPKAPIPNQIGPFTADLSSGAPFAEIEIRSPSGGASRVSPAGPIGPRAADPIREKFYAMRKLAYGMPFARNDARLFYRQAKFMEGFTDDYSGNARFSMYYPCYQYMGYEQLRTYFTWRAKARRGEFPPSSPSYVYLYVYELLSGIGGDPPARGLERLTVLWKAYRERERSLDCYLPCWIKDFYVYYALPGCFTDFALEHGLQGQFPEQFLSVAGPASGLALWNGVSGYDITKSRFYGDGNGPLVSDCFDAVLFGVRELCGRHHCGIEMLLTNGAQKEAPWYPFQRALFFPWFKQPDRRVEMRGPEIYVCKDNRWTASTPVPYWGRREFVGYLLKKTEACLRRAMKYRYRITANPRSFLPAFHRLKALGIPFAEFDAAIEQAVACFHKDLTRTVVAVDHRNLARIRREAQGTRDKLTVPEDIPPAMSVETPSERMEWTAPERDGWAALKGALSPAELKALSMILRGGAGIKALADETGVMQEVLADSINEKAADTVGDSIIEMAGGMKPYEEYRERIAEMVG